MLPLSVVVVSILLVLGFLVMGMQQSINFENFLDHCHSQWVCQIRLALFNR